MEFPRVVFRPVVTALVCLAIAGIAVALAAWAGEMAFGLFFGLGLLLGLANALMVQRSVTSITAEANPAKNKLALNSATRLLLITVVALALAFLFRPTGFGVFFGLAAFQVYLVLSTTLPVWKKLRNGELDEPVAAQDSGETVHAPSTDTLIKE